MSEAPRDIRYGHDLTKVQDEAGIDLLQLQEQLKLSPEERLRRLEQHSEFVKRLRGAAVK